MSAVIKKVALFYSVLLLSVYTVVKTLMFFDLQWNIFSIIERIVILPMGCMVILYFFASSRVLLEESGLHHRLYEILILIFGMLLMALFFFASFLPS